MKIKDIIKITAIYLGREKVINCLESDSTTTDDGNVLSCIDTLTRCANLVINELADSYIPMTKTEEVTAINGKIEYSSLTENLIRLKSIKDGLNKEIDYKAYATYIKVEGHSTVTVEYDYMPSQYGLTDETGYTEKDVSARVLAYGVAAEYLLTEHSYSESLMWHKRYENGIAEICMPKNGKIKGRSFI